MIKLELSQEMLAIIASALGNHPYRMAAPVVAEIQRQIDSQIPKNGKGGPIVVDTGEKSDAPN